MTKSSFTWLLSSKKSQVLLTHSLCSESKTLILWRLLVQTNSLLLYLRNFKQNYLKSFSERKMFPKSGSCQLFILYLKMLVCSHLHHIITPSTSLFSLVNSFIYYQQCSSWQSYQKQPPERQTVWVSLL